MNILITVCGRAGSKGVKNKNLRDFLGKPLVYYTFQAAKLFKVKNNKYTIDICINSDSDKLLELGNQFGNIETIKRPYDLATDESAKIPSIRYSLVKMEEKKKKEYDFIIDLDITSPFRKLEDIENALNKSMANENIDVVFSVVESRRNPYFNMVEKKDGKIMKVKESDYIRRQDAPKVYDMNASIYCYKRESLLNKIKESPFEGANDIIIMQDTAVLDIDSEEDFELMEVLGKYYSNNEYKLLFDGLKEK
jgi:CMP-N,N'-diacetyllegionaminic acid synthase